MLQLHACCTLRTAVVTMILLTQACSSQWKEQLKPPVAIPKQFSQSGSVKTQGPWWQVFEDDQLKGLMSQGMAGNLDLKAAQERLKAARAAAGTAAGEYYPELTASASGTQELSKEGVDNGLTLGLALSYEVDLFGGIDAYYTNREYLAKARLLEVQAVAWQLSGEIAKAWYSLLSYRELVKLLEDQVSINERLLQSIAARIGVGQIRGADLLRQKQVVARKKGELIEAMADLRVAELALNFLLGNMNHSDLPSQGELSVLVELPETGVPLQVINRRPDVGMAYMTLLAADRMVAVKISQRFPRLTLGLSSVGEGESSNALFKDWVTTIAGELLAPLLDFGRRSYQVDEQKAGRQEELYRYGRQILLAMREVEESITRDRSQVRIVSNYRSQQDLARRAYEQLQLEYLNGVGSYIGVLSALTELQTINQELLTARRLAIHYRVDLLRALAGNFNSYLETGEEHASTQRP